MRGPYEGMWNVVRFNWPMYAVGCVVVLIAAISTFVASGTWAAVFAVLTPLSMLGLLLPLIASHVIYDRSALYALPWLADLGPDWTGALLNINAGFDEISFSIRRRLPKCDLQVVDFYDASKHTERSIERARSVYPAFPGTRAVDMTSLPFPNRSIDIAVAFLSLHEVRDDGERIRALTELRRVLAPTGRLIVSEHLRDVANFCAFNFGFFHFHARSTWLRAFGEAGFRVLSSRRTTPFITTFILEPL